MSAQPAHHPYASALRQRAAHLRDLAALIERTSVMALGDGADTKAWSTTRAQLCEVMLARNVQQLYQAAEDLRYTAYRFRQRADEMDMSTRISVVA